MRVVGRDEVDGTRFHLEGGAWTLVRFSGTEPLLRIYAEAESQERVYRILEAVRALAEVGCLTWTVRGRTSGGTPLT